MVDSTGTTELVTSVISFPVREKSSLFLKNSASLIAEYSPQVGFQGGFCGAHFPEPEDGDKEKLPVHWMLNWNSYQDALTFTDQSNFPTFASTILQSSRIPSIYHAILKNLHAPTLAAIYAAPAIESVRLHLKREVDKAAWQESFGKFEEALRMAEGYHAHVTGWVVEEEYDLFIMIGWVSVKAHRDWIAIGGGQAAVDKYIMDWTTGYKMVHIISGQVIPVQGGNS